MSQDNAPHWEPYLSVLAGSFGVRNTASAWPMSSFRPTEDLEEARQLADQMNAEGYSGDGIDYPPSLSEVG